MRILLLAGVCAGLFVPALSAHADLITNGNFDTTSSRTPSQVGYSGYTVQGWTSNTTSTGSLGYNFVFNPSLAGSAAYTSNGQYGDVQLYTSANGGSASAPSNLSSPMGGQFLAADGAFQTSVISQLVNGLTIGDDYRLSFYWAASQQAGFSGVTTESWNVSFGNQSFTTATVTNPDRGFTPWTQVSYVFHPTSTSQTLSFLASGGPSGSQTPLTLLDGVTLNDVTTASPVPEPASLVLLGTVAIGAAALRRRRSTAESGN